MKALARYQLVTKYNTE